VIPLLVPELGRPRDAFWGGPGAAAGPGAGHQREQGSAERPLLGVSAAGLLIGRLSTEVGPRRLAPNLAARNRQRFWAQGTLAQSSLQQSGPPRQAAEPGGWAAFAGVADC